MRFTVDENLRLDVFLAKALNQSRNQITALIKKDCIKVNGNIENKNSFKLKVADELVVENLPLKQELSQKYAVNFDVSVLFEDDDLLVLNKPSGLVVHAANSVKEATLVDWLIEKNFTLSNLSGTHRAGLVHRLDKQTSGAILIAKNNNAHQFLSKQLADKTMGRIYLALIDLPLKEDKIIIQKALIRSNQNPIKKQAINHDARGSKSAKSAFLNVICSKDCALIAAKLFTGRTHQIRAHLASVNRHILGDVLYGYKGKQECRVMLHSYFLYFNHPKTQEKVFVKAPLLDDFKELLLEKFNLGEDDEKISLEFLLSGFNSFL